MCIYIYGETKDGKQRINLKRMREWPEKHKKTQKSDCPGSKGKNILRKGLGFSTLKLSELLLKICLGDRDGQDHIQRKD
jgi:hypothetical protein